MKVSNYLLTFIRFAPFLKIKIEDEVEKRKNNKENYLVCAPSVDEAVYFADKVAVISARLGRIIECVDINIARPRSDQRRAKEQEKLANSSYCKSLQ